MRTRLFISILLAVLSVAAHSEQLYVVFTDPVGDSLGLVDVVGMGLSFDKVTGAYSLLLLADASDPFEGDLRININLYNPDTGTTDCDPSFFEDNLNDYLGYPTSTILVLSGASHHLKSWDVGDRVATNTVPFGDPDCSSLFRSAVVDLDHPSQGDLIAYGDTYARVFAPVIFVDGSRRAQCHQVEGC